jgi:predicted enzyme related to lactoylglutathione lyase
LYTLVPSTDSNSDPSGEGAKVAGDELVCSFTSSWIIAETVDAVVAHGGKIVQPIGADVPEITARFRDPAGNVLGLYQQS